MFKTIAKQDEPILASESQKRYLVQLLYSRISDAKTLERWLDYLDSATRDEANQILLDFS